MLRYPLLVLVLLAFSLASSACSVFDDKLWKTRTVDGASADDAAEDEDSRTDLAAEAALPDTAGDRLDAGTDRTVDAAKPDASDVDVPASEVAAGDGARVDGVAGDVPSADASLNFPLGERCENAVNIASSNVAFTIDTTSMANDYQDLAVCTGSDQRGNDGFLAVDMKAGEKWHIHIATMSAALDPAVYILPSCDERTCQTGMGADECGAGKPEHMSFLPATSGRYVVGVDSKNAGGGVYSVLVVHPVCGNGGTPEHSETCDDGNTMSGDGCDSLCRKELAQGGSEVEPNDDPLAANVLPSGTPPFSATASALLGGRCDQDMFAVTLPAGGTLRAKLLTAGGQTCPVGVANLQLKLVAPDGRTEIGMGANVDAEGCPAIDARHTFSKVNTAGVYYLKVITTDAANFNYQLKVDVSP